MFKHINKHKDKNILIKCKRSAEQCQLGLKIHYLHLCVVQNDMVKKTYKKIGASYSGKSI